MSSPFVSLRSIVESIKSDEDTQSNTIDLIAESSHISELYLQISKQRYDLSERVYKLIDELKILKSGLENDLYKCQQMSLQIQQLSLPQLGMDETVLVSIDEFISKKGIPKEVVEKMDKNRLLKERLDYERIRSEQVKEQYHSIKSRSCELMSRLETVSRIYAPIISKLNDFQENLNQFMNKKLKENK